MTSYVIEADGGSRGNPGPAGYGAVVMSPDGEVLAEAAEAIGVATNNVAEYRGLIAGLTAVLRLGGDGASVAVRMDSKLVVEQMAGRWKIKNEGLRPLALEAGALARRLRVTEWTWIPRERNKHADRLANEAMDAAAKGLTWKAGEAPFDRPAPAAAQQTDLLEVSSPSASLATAQSKGTGWGPPSRTATSLLLLRHGETAMSVERRFSGIGDPPLTAKGLAQAEAVAQRLSREPYKLDVIVSSPLERARATAGAVARLAGLDVEVDEGLRETDFGAWEGHTFTEIQRRWPGELAAWLDDPAVAPPEGESFESTARRVQESRDRLVEQYTGRTVLVVSHVTPIKTLLRLALMAPPAALYRMHLDLACLSLIDYFTDGPSVVKSFNDTGHLR
ncbi:bifunctional RNase H/acid phosphatase [Nonomuraea sp. NPDC050556]|uniref:bifunctional RNase H/acid phosphatase n=1 Tax=Nonomuraea sp. NPDC050556 TaxID=3364369 RepID=UPI0037A02CCC